VEEDLPLETCDTLHANGAWGFTSDRTAKTREEVSFSQYTLRTW